MPRPGPKKNHGRTRRRNHHPDRNRLRQNLSCHAATGRTGTRICGGAENVRLHHVLRNIRFRKNDLDADHRGRGVLHLRLAGHGRTDRAPSPDQLQILDHRRHERVHVPPHHCFPGDSGKMRNLMSELVEKHRLECRTQNNLSRIWECTIIMFNNSVVQQKSFYRLDANIEMLGSSFSLCF